MSISGRRPNEKTRSFGRSILDGLSAIGTALADGPKYQRIKEIDAQIVELRQERDHLVHGLIEPGDLKVSDDYDPRWRKAAVADDADAVMPDIFSSGEGRLTKCGGRTTMSRYHDAHPGCPYVAQVHNEHEFTLRD